MSIRVLRMVAHKVVLEGGVPGWWVLHTVPGNQAVVPSDPGEGPTCPGCTTLTSGRAAAVEPSAAQLEERPGLNLLPKPG